MDLTRRRAGPGGPGLQGLPVGPDSAGGSAPVIRARFTVAQRPLTVAWHWPRQPGLAESHILVTDRWSSSNRGSGWQSNSTVTGQPEWPGGFQVSYETHWQA